VNRKVLLAGFLPAALAVVLPLLASAQVLTRSGLSTLNGASSVVAADFNQDGIIDLAVGLFGGSDGVQVFLGKGDGTFKPGVEYAPGTGPGALAAADINHDGIPDIVIANGTGDSVIVLLGNGDGTFQAPVTYAIPSAPVSVVLGDFNNDGNLDIATAVQSDFNTSCFCVAVLLGNGNGTFQEPAIVTYPTYSLPEALASGNFNGDGNLDLALTENFTSSAAAQILLGNGDGTFSLGASYTVDPSPESIVAADLRNNGITDLAVASLESPGLAVLLGNGDGTFQQAVYYDLGFRNPYVSASSLTVAVGAMNGDGVPDLVAAAIVVSNNTNYSGVFIFPGKGDGTFGSPGISAPVASNSFPRGLALADFNGDHQLDLTFADEFGTHSGISEYVLLNTGNVKFSPITPLSFKNQKQGTTSPPQTVTLTNEGKASLSITSITTKGEFGATSTCGKTVAAKTSCSISVTFSPKAAGAFSGTVQINDSASSKPQVIALSGKGF
jgi:FG-GAP-like repeat/Abnormal spindle-like microcephaly-assoc'd, ASPM-SPD-2-Hydin